MDELLQKAQANISDNVDKQEKENFNLSINAVEDLIKKAKEIDPKLEN